MHKPKDFTKPSDGPHIKISIPSLADRDAIGAALRQRNPKAGAHTDRKKEADRKACRIKVKDTD